MIRSIDIDKKSKLAFYSFEISVNEQSIIIRETKLPIKDQNAQLPDEKMHIIQLHVENIPALLGLISRIYQTVDGGVDYIVANGDELTVGLLFDDRGYFDYLDVSDGSGRNKLALSNRIKFIFEDKFHVNDPLPRIPTPAMVWVADTLKQIHDEWKKKTDGAAVNA